MKPTLVELVYQGFVTIELWRVPGIKNLRVVVRCTDSIAGVLHDVVNRRVLFIREPHVAAITKKNKTGKLVTPFAGRFDRKLSPKQLLISEADQEVGAILTEDDVIMLNHGVSMVLSIGLITERAYLAYAQISPNKLVGNDNDTFGLKDEGEEIKRVWIPEDILLSDTFVCHDLRILTFRQHIQIMRLKEENAKLQMRLDKQPLRHPLG